VEQVLPGRQAMTDVSSTIAPGTVTRL